MLKTLLYTTVLTIPSSLAVLQMDSIIDLAEQSLKMLNQTLPKFRGRSSVNVFFEDLQEYGCWCYFDTLHGKGKGTPVDNFDLACLNQHHAITCLKMENCDLTESFTPQLILDPNSPGGISYDCISANGGNACKENLCYATSHFTSKVLDLMIDIDNGARPKYNTYKHSRGFEPSTCRIAGSGPSIDEEKCCGNYEFNTRRPIRVPSGKRRECCENSAGIFVTYNPDFKQCCSGSVESFGTC